MDVTQLNDWAGSHSSHILNPLQKECYHAHYINIHKICLFLSCISLLLCLSYVQHSLQGLFLVHAWSLAHAEACHR